MLSTVLKSDGGMDMAAFEAKYQAMDKNADGKISQKELVDTVVELGRERNLFGEKGAPQAPVEKKQGVVQFAIADENDDPVDV